MGGVLYQIFVPEIRTQIKKEEYARSSVLVMYLSDLSNAGNENLFSI